RTDRSQREAVVNDGNRFSRLRLLVGEEALARIACSHMVVAGLGAVGSFAVEGLARSGVGCLKLIDFDTVEPSNTNRQLYALTSTMCRPKADLAAARVRDINPECRVESIVDRITKGQLESLLTPYPDVVVDAIDTVRDKVSLLAWCIAHAIPVVSSMGVARRTDPLSLRVGELGSIQGCPLARCVRTELRKLGIGDAIRCVFSVERPATMPNRQQTGDFEPRAMGSSVCVTGTAGLLMAREALKMVLG
ncbi:MAG: tRNA threonylcarbamoyladenosine dehydratase, partial [Kiritimatiellae bacterium]|nr:tRNA threonylcarbamoyladenosine dehydratase [Kiritimatiellia bacterium]